VTSSRDPLGKRALFEASAPGPANGHNQGAGRAFEAIDRRALFSAPERRRGTVVVECRTCEARTPVPLVSLGWYLFPSVWLPWLDWPYLMRCPSCHRYWSSCRISVRGS
jgi:hypothetical protein